MLVSSTTRKQLETARFSLKPLCGDHLNLLMELFTDPEVMQYVSGDPYSPARASVEAAAVIRHESDRPRLGAWAVHDRTGDEVHGWVALQKLTVDDVEVGFRIRRQSWGKGIATEAGARLVDYAF